MCGLREYVSLVHAAAAAAAAVAARTVVTHRGNKKNLALEIEAIAPKKPSINETGFANGPYVHCTVVRKGSEPKGGNVSEETKEKKIKKNTNRARCAFS